jgi:hypothetical protein
MEYLRNAKASIGDFSPWRAQANRESLVKIGCKMAENPIFVIDTKTLSETIVIPHSLTIHPFPFRKQNLHQVHHSMQSIESQQNHDMSYFIHLDINKYCTMGEENGASRVNAGGYHLFSSGDWPHIV